MAKKELSFGKVTPLSSNEQISQRESPTEFASDEDNIFGGTGSIPEDNRDDEQGDSFGTFQDGSLNSDQGILSTLLDSGSGNDGQSEWIKQLLTDENLLLKTDVPERAIPAIAKAIVLANKYRSKRLWDYIIYYLKLRISREREGRKELVAMALRTKGHDELDDF